MRVGLHVGRPYGRISISGNLHHLKDSHGQNPHYHADDTPRSPPRSTRRPSKSRGRSNAWCCPPTGLYSPRPSRPSGSARSCPSSTATAPATIRLGFDFARRTLATRSRDESDTALTHQCLSHRAAVRHAVAEGAIANASAREQQTQGLGCRNGGAAHTLAAMRS